MKSMYDLYMTDKIMGKCEEYFLGLLAEGGLGDEHLTEDDREIVSQHIEWLLGMAADIDRRSKDDREKGYEELVDNLVGVCVINKMNEVRLCRLLSERYDKDGDV